MSTEQSKPMTLTIEDKNRVIAEFMGGKSEKLTWRQGEPMGITFEQVVHYLRSHKITELKYHSSWDWLMPVVDRIFNEEEMFIDFTIPFYHQPYFQRKEIRSALLFIDIKLVYESVFYFITLYNQQSINQVNK